MHCNHTDKGLLLTKTNNKDGEDMKKCYEKATIEVILLENRDVVMTSGVVMEWDTFCDDGTDL